jgi:glutamate/aspartate transport system substrate-binding protein
MPRTLACWLRFIAIASLALLHVVPASAQEQEHPAGALTGTLKKIRDSGSIVLGYREASFPFSYLNRRQQPIGYSIDLCQEIVDDVSIALDTMAVNVVYKPVTPENRIEMVVSGAIDLECGSTTSSFQRRKQVAFSPVIFVSGTKLLVRRNSPVRSYTDLVGKTVVVTAGTTNEAAIHALSDKQKLGIRIITAPDHAQSFDLLAAGRADAFASDDILLYGLMATAKDGADFRVVGDFFSYDPYGLMYRKDDPDFATVVDRTFTRLAKDRQLSALYKRWFLRRLPTGETLNVPMNPQLQEIFLVLGEPE